MHRRIDDLEVIDYSDSDYVGYIDTKKSISGYIFMLVGGVISRRSAKQSLNATSTIKVEFISYFEAISHGVWFKSFIFELRVVDLFLGY